MDDVFRDIIRDHDFPRLFNAPPVKNVRNHVILGNQNRGVDAAVIKRLGVLIGAVGVVIEILDSF